MRTQGPAGSCKTADVVVGGESIPISVGPVSRSRRVSRLLRDTIGNRHCGRHDGGRSGGCKEGLSKVRQFSSSDESSGSERGCPGVDVALPHALNGRSNFTIGPQLGSDEMVLTKEGSAGARLKCRENLEISQRGREWYCDCSSGCNDVDDDDRVD